MSRFKKSEKRSVPQPPSGSLSDIVFMLLFFFMVTTTMRETENKVMVKLPEASEVAKLERKDLTSYINIGTPIRASRLSMVTIHVSSSTTLSRLWMRSATSSQQSVTPCLRQTDLS